MEPAYSYAGIDKTAHLISIVLCKNAFFFKKGNYVLQARIYIHLHFYILHKLKEF